MKYACIFIFIICIIIICPSCLYIAEATKIKFRDILFSFLYQK